jgi:hypothetical protein
MSGGDVPFSTFKGFFKRSVDPDTMDFTVEPAGRPSKVRQPPVAEQLFQLWIGYLLSISVNVVAKL